MKVEIIPVAQREIAEAANYYDRARPGLGDELLNEFDIAVKRIISDPSMFEPVRPGIRRCLVDRFPYGIYYRVPDPNTVRIIVVKHHARRPGLGMRRK